MTSPDDVGVKLGIVHFSLFILFAIGYLLSFTNCHASKDNICIELEPSSDFVKS